MSLKTFDELLKQKKIDGIYFADSSFIICAEAGRSTTSGKRYKSAYALKKHILDNGGGIIYTGLVKNEVTHKLRQLLFATAIENELKNFPKVVRVYKDSKNDLKQIVVNGYIESFGHALGKNGVKLESELKNYFRGCTYIETEKMKPKPDWDNVSKMMALYGLDSTDAMLLNFTVSQKTFSGFISMDADFQFCSDVGDFDIVLPSNIISNHEGPKALE